MNNISSSFWLDRPVLVTGAFGLVGSSLTSLLVQAGADVVALERDWIPQSALNDSGLRNKVKVVSGSVEDMALCLRILGEYEIDTVIHLAAQTIVTISNRNPLSTFESNIRGTWVLLEACRQSPLVKQVVIASSDKAYGDQAVLPYTEDTPLQGKHPYDVSKSCADLIAQSFAQTFNLPIAISRCGNFYGGGDLNWSRIVPGTIRSIIRGERPVIRSDGKSIRDYFYVEDGAAAYMMLAEALAKNPDIKGEAFNFSNETQLSVLELTERILMLMNTDLQPDVRNEASNEIRHQYLSAKKAHDMLGWAPHFDFDTGLRRTIDWYSHYFANDKKS